MNFEKVRCYSFTTTENNSSSQIQWILNHSSYYLEIPRTNAKCLDKNHNERFELLDLCTRGWPSVYYFIQWRNWDKIAQNRWEIIIFYRNCAWSLNRLYFKKENFSVDTLATKQTRSSCRLFCLIWTWRNTYHSCHILNLPNSRTLLFKLQRHLEPPWRDD